MSTSVLLVGAEAAEAPEFVGKAAEVLEDSALEQAYQ